MFVYFIVCLLDFCKIKRNNKLRKPSNKKVSNKRFYTNSPHILKIINFTTVFTTVKYAVKMKANKSCSQGTSITFSYEAKEPFSLFVVDRWLSFSTLLLSELSCTINITNYNEINSLKIIWYPQ